MKTATIITLSIIAALALAWGAVERSQLKVSEAKLITAGEHIKTSGEALTAQQQSSAQLQARVEQLSGSVVATTEMLASAKSQIAALSNRLAPFEASAEDRMTKQQLAKMQPVLKSGDVIIFPRLLSPSNNLLLENAEFRKTFGRKLIFKTGLSLATFDVDEVHPGALIQLGIDPEKLKGNQVALDKADANFKAAMAAAAQMKLAQDGSFIEKQAAQNAAQAKIDEARRQRQAVEDRQQQVINNDRIRANAAMAEALRPIY